MKAITSRDNPRFKRLRKWAVQGRARRLDGVILLDDLHLIEALEAAGECPVEVALAESAVGKPEIAGWLASHRGIDALCLPDALLAEVAATETPSGIVAVAPAPQPAAAPDTKLDSVLLDGVQDPGNVGTLLRTAAAAGIRQALLSPGCADPWAPKTLRAGQGAQFRMSVHESVDLATFLTGYAGKGIVTLPDAAATLWDVPMTGPQAWVFGAEGQGVSTEVAAAAGVSLRIPMPGGMESLNVAAAAAICLFEQVRRRQVIEP
jgi:TrmH family RNA methyltransferase